MKCRWSPARADPTLSTAQPTSGDSVTVKIGALTNSRPMKDGFSLQHVLQIERQNKADHHLGDTDQ